MKIIWRSPVLFFMFCFYSCVHPFGECEVSPTERLPNKAGNLQAVKVLIDCGATTTPSSTLRIVESTDTTNNGEPGNSVLERVAAANLYWKSNDTLVISGIDSFPRQLKDSVFNLKKSKGRVIIQYEAPVP